MATGKDAKNAIRHAVRTTGGYVGSSAKSQARRAGSYASRRAMSAASSIGSSLSKNEWTIIKAAGAGVVIVGVGYAIYSVVNSFTGNTCLTPGSPCYTATQAPLEEFNTCLSQYTNDLNSFLVEDSGAGTGFTQAQLDTLAQYRTCMNNATTALASSASQFSTSPLDTLIAWIAPAVAAAIGAYGAVKAFNALKFQNLKTGSAAADAVNNSVMSTLVDNGAITADAASTLSSNVATYTDTLTTENTSVLNDYVATTVGTANPITSEVAADAAEEDAVLMEEDQATVQLILAGLGYSGYRVRGWHPRDF